MARITPGADFGKILMNISNLKILSSKQSNESTLLQRNNYSFIIIFSMALVLPHYK
jgi:hypothetical protein